MENSGLNRRDFQRLTAAAVGGLLAGASLGSSAQAEDAKPPQKDKKKNPILGEPHVCRGINMCKGLGSTKDNACAGQGACATAKDHLATTRTSVAARVAVAPSPARTSARARANVAFRCRAAPGRRPVSASKN